MKRHFIICLAFATLATACTPSTDQIETSAPPTETPEELPPQPTEPIYQDESPTQSDDTTPIVAGLIDPGRYLIGTDEDQIEPGVYFGSGPECAWERLSGLDGTMNQVIAAAGPVRQFYVEILDTDVAFRLKWCSMAPLDELPEPTEISLPIQPGVYLIGRDIESGLYQGHGDSCYWERLSGLAGTYEYIIDNDRPDGQFYVDIQDTDVAFVLRDCNMMPLSQIPEPSEFLTHLEPGMYLVGRDIEAGLYQGVGEDSCYWQRRSNFAGGREGLIESDAPEGAFEVQIEPTDLLFRISWCSVDRVE